MEKLVKCIQLEADVIDELFLLLAQHIDADELSQLPCVEKIRKASQLKGEIEN